jgi:hypothetical protein
MPPEQSGGITSMYKRQTYITKSHPENRSQEEVIGRGILICSCS